LFKKVAIERASLPHLFIVSSINKQVSLLLVLFTLDFLSSVP